MIEMSTLEPVLRMSRDIRAAAATLTTMEARYLVDTYYQMQDARIRDAARIRQQSETEEPHSTLAWLYEQNETLESQIKGALGKYAAAHPVGSWSQSICGIGPVISAGLLANIDMTRAPTAGALWKYAGLDGFSKKPEKGVKFSHNRDFKTLCAFKIGESFVKVQSNKNDVYGKVYAERKRLEIECNEAGVYADQAKAKLDAFKIDKTTEAYKHYSSGKLPPAHIHARARRYAVKLFLSHLHEVWHWHAFGEEAPKPYAFEHLGHAHLIAAPYFDKETFPVMDPPLPRPVRSIEPV